MSAAGGRAGGQELKPKIKFESESFFLDAALPGAASVIRYNARISERFHATASTCRQEGPGVPSLIERLFGPETLHLTGMP
jgi:hypothetical protein